MTVMPVAWIRLLLKLSPLVVVTGAAAVWFNHVQDGGPYVLRNLLPPTLLVLLAFITLWRGNGRWTGAGWKLPLATVGFAMPALGLSLYLHYAYAVNLNDMFGDAIQPGQLFRFLPAYTLFAAAIGAAIGWTVGRNI
ncbi:MAG: hypothetical protein IIA78_05765 [Proteobacteria bacterium]|nr:hypothetical protein [Pseudomonadota bacterium]